MRFDKILVEDTRQQKGKHRNVEIYCKENGIKLVRNKLMVGDYTLPTDQRICVDTKCGMLELSMDLGRDRDRFKREAITARNMGIRLVILVENEEGIKSASDVLKWVNPISIQGHRNYTPHAMTGSAIAKRMQQFHQYYDVEFRFCSKQETGKVLGEIFFGGDAGVGG